jgi:ABC-type dipeptide/oligopeptide/nickel transport system permease component
MVLAVFGVMLITFLLFNIIGGDISFEYVGRNADKETLDKIRKELGTDKPLLLAVELTCNYSDPAPDFNKKPFFFVPLW